MPRPTIVVRIKKKNGVELQGCDEYIGRECKMGGWNLPQSKYANPFTVKKYGSARVAVEKYKEHLEKMIQRDPELRDQIKRDLGGKILGCWCKPGPCHGDVLADICNRSD